MVLLLFPTFFDIMKQALHIPDSAHRGSTENNRWGSPSPLSIAHKKSRFPGHWLLCSWKNSLKFRVAKSSKYRWEEKEGFMSLIPDPGLWDPLQTLQDSQTDSRPAESSSRLLTPPLLLLSWELVCTHYNHQLQTDSLIPRSSACHTHNAGVS